MRLRIAIQNTVIGDIDGVFRLYRGATELQKEKGVVQWPVFDRGLIETEIAEKRQWKIVIDNTIACVWSMAFDDPQIWGERDGDAAIYIHRIATNLMFRGNNLVGEIVEFMEGYARANQKRFIRMDTVGENRGLIAYYTKCGFEFLGLSRLTDTDGLPAHYHNATVCLFQMDIGA